MNGLSYASVHSTLVEHQLCVNTVLSLCGENGASTVILGKDPTAERLLFDMGRRREAEIRAEQPRIMCQMRGPKAVWRK